MYLQFIANTDNLMQSKVIICISCYVAIREEFKNKFKITLIICQECHRSYELTHGNNSNFNNTSHDSGKVNTRLWSSTDNKHNHEH